METNPNIYDASIVCPVPDDNVFNILNNRQWSWIEWLFNLKLLQDVYSLGNTVIYHIPPKAWSHGKKRTELLKNYCHLVTSILPFETQFFNILILINFIIYSFFTKSKRSNTLI